MNLSDYDALTFDCYGTLIDWETGILSTLRPWSRGQDLSLSDDELLQGFARHEARLELNRPALNYRDVLRGVLQGLASELHVEADHADVERFADSVRDWPAFPDSRAALAYLRQHFKLVVVSNIDLASFDHSAEILGRPFHAVVTAEDVGSYKPALPHFDRAKRILAEMGVESSAWLHVAQSLYHDIAVANHLGLASVWVDRREGRAGGATSDSAGTPDLRVTSLGALADLHRAEVAGD
jgi:2-haloalkanoic acid dehalogenase type II